MLLSSTLLILTLYTFGRIIIVNRRHKNIMIDVLILLGFILLNILVFKYITGTIKTIITCLLYSSLFFSIFKIKLSKSVFTSIVYVILLVIPDLLILSTAIYILGISKEYYYSVIASGLIGNLSVLLIMILLTYIIRKPLRKLMKYKLSENKKIVVISVLAIIFTAIFFYKFATGYKMNQDVIIYLIAMFAFIVILFTLFRQRMDNEKVSKKYDELLDVMKNYESDIEEQRTLRHETKNEFATIKCKLQDKEDNKTIIEYIDSVIGEKGKASSTKYSKFKYLPSNGLKGFFYYKFIEAEKKGINVSINISKQIENSFLKDIDTKDFKDLARIVGVYLDNAIEASSTSEDKKLGIEMYLIKEKIELIITNTFNNEINLDKIGKESFSTKGKHRGHGLLLVNKILSENNMFEAKNEIRDNIYIQSLKIKDNKKNYDE
jgi:two-component system sensor histidine kinase AgrC